jgi:hypothetical protein
LVHGTVGGKPEVESAIAYSLDGMGFFLKKDFHHIYCSLCLFIMQRLFCKNATGNCYIATRGISPCCILSVTLHIIGML